MCLVGAEIGSVTAEQPDLVGSLPEPRGLSRESDSSVPSLFTKWGYFLASLKKNDAKNNICQTGYVFFISGGKLICHIYAVTQSLKDF